jgi:hypothetical protein
VAGQWFSPGTLVSSTNKTDCHDIAEIMLKMGLNTKTPITDCLIQIPLKSKGTKYHFKQVKVPGTASY